MMALAIHKTDEFCKEPAKMSENELRRECATIHKTDGFCKELAKKSENELRTLSRMARTPEIEKCKQFNG